MSDQDILEKAIQQAIGNGWSMPEWPPEQANDAAYIDLGAQL